MPNAQNTAVLLRNAGETRVIVYPFLSFCLPPFFYGLMETFRLPSSREKGSPADSGAKNIRKEF